MKRFLFVLAIGAVLAGSVTAAPSYSASMSWSRGSPGSTWQEWTFDDEDNPAAPENANNPYGNPLAHLYGDNLGHWSSYDDHAGVWHAGSPEDDLLYVTLNIPNNEVLNEYKEVWMEVVYRVEVANFGIAPSFVQTDPEGVDIDLLGWSVTEEDPGNPGTWRTAVFHWRLSPNPFSEMICIDFSGTGGMIDSVTVDTICTSIPAPGAIGLAAIGTYLVGWMWRRRTL